MKSHIILKLSTIMHVIYLISSIWKKIIFMKLVITELIALWLCKRLNYICLITIVTNYLGTYYNFDTNWNWITSCTIPIVRDVSGQSFNTMGYAFGFWSLFGSSQDESGWVGMSFDPTNSHPYILYNVQWMVSSFT